MWTVIKVWAVINLIGCAIATAAGIYRYITGDEDNEQESANG
jgi:hypothetical protein